MCYEFFSRNKAQKNEVEQRKESVSMSRQVNAWILEAKMALITNKRKHPEMEAQTPSKVRERLAG